MFMIQKVFKAEIPRWRLVFMAAFACAFVWTGMAAATTLSPAQLEQLKQLSPAQQAALAKQVGVSLPARKSANVPTTSPVVVKPRTPGSSALERGMQAPSPIEINANALKATGRNHFKAIASGPGNISPIVAPKNYLINTGDKVVVRFFGQIPDAISKFMPQETNQTLSMIIDRDGLIAVPGIGKLFVRGMGASEVQLAILGILKKHDATLANKINIDVSIYILPQRAFANFVSKSKPMAVDTHIKQFGYDLFAGAPTTFAPATDVPVPSEYVLGPGDEIKVQLFGKENSKFSMTVDREGVIAFPDIGPLTVASMRFAEARAFIAQQIKQKMIGVSASITMGQLRSIRVFALGEVARPGSYVVSGLATLSNALFVSGGVKKTGSLRNIQLKRAGKVVATLDLYDFLMHGDTSHDVRLLPQDVVYVPPIGYTVGVAGQVLRPAIFELKHKRALADVLRLAGGLRPTAYSKKVQIERIARGAERKVLDVPLTGKGRKTRLHDGDLVKVYSVLDFEENPVFLLGNVKRPGKYAWHQGMHLRDLIPNNDVLLPETYFRYAVIERESARSREPVILHVPLGSVLAGKQSMILAPRDKVYVFNRTHFREQLKVTIVGNVQSPGGYALKKNMHLVDLLMAAGGLLRDASLGTTELYRTDTKTKVVTRMTVNMDRALKGNQTDNPLLRDMDRVVIHSIWESKMRYKVSVSGEVKHPGEFTLAAGMHLTDLLFVAGNVTERAYMQQAEITRYTVENNERRVARHIQVDLTKALRGDVAANILLEPYDVLTVRRMSNWRDIEHATVTGEVRFPGSYPVEDGERLSSLLARVGGFTAMAYLPAAVFTRTSIRETQRKNLEKLGIQMEADMNRQVASISNIKDPIILKRQQQDLERARALLKQMREAKATGRLVIRLADMKHFKNSDFDLRLRDGDTLYIPQRPDQVLVMGQVYNQAALLYRHGFSPDDYVDMAGGAGQFADTDRIYVIRANGEVDAHHSAWRRKQVYPGDTVVVPQELGQFHLVDSLLDWGRVGANIGLTIAAFSAVGVL